MYLEVTEEQRKTIKEALGLLFESYPDPNSEEAQKVARMFHSIKSEDYEYVNER